MNRKERLLKLLREELKLVEDKLIEYPPDGKNELFDELVKEAKRIVETIKIIETETP